MVNSKIYHPQQPLEYIRNLLTQKQCLDARCTLWRRAKRRFGRRIRVVQYVLPRAGMSDITINHHLEKKAVRPTVWFGCFLSSTAASSTRIACPGSGDVGDEQLRSGVSHDGMALRSGILARVVGIVRSLLTFR